MKKIISFLILLVSLTAYAQNEYKAKFSSPFEDKNNLKEGIYSEFTTNTLIHADGTYSYYIRVEDDLKNKGALLAILERYDSNLKREKISEALLKFDDKRKTYLAKVFFFNNKATIFYTGLNSKINADMFGITMSLQGVKSAPVLIETFSAYDGIMKYVVTDDSLKLFAYKLSSNYGSGKLSNVPIKLFDGDLNVTVETGIPPKYNYRDWDIQNVSFSDAGNLFFTMGKYVSDFKVGEVRKYEYKFCSVTNNLHKFNEMLIPFEDGNYFHSGKMKVWNEDNIYLDGYITKKVDKVTGIYHISINANTMKFNFFNAGDFSADMQSKLFEEVDANRKGDVSIMVPEILSILGRNDGGYTVMRQSSVRSYNIVVVTSIDNRGKEEWNTLLTSGYGENFPSSNDFNLIPAKDKLYLFYTDSKDNTLTTSRTQLRHFPYEEACLVVADIDGQGKLTRHVISTPPSDKEYLRNFYRVERIASFQDGEFILQKIGDKYFMPGLFVVK